MNLPYLYLDKKRIILYAEIGSVILLVAALVVYVIFFSQVRLVNRDETPEATKTSVFKERERSTFFDATFLGYNQEKNTITIVLTKDGQSTQEDLEISQVNLNRVQYDHATTNILKTEKIKASDIPFGANLKLITTGADINFELEKVKEVQVLERK